MTNRYSTHHPGLILPRNLDSHLPPWQQQSSKKHHSSNSHASSSSQSNGGSTSSSGHRDDRQILMGADIFIISRYGGMVRVVDTLFSLSHLEHVTSSTLSLF